MVHAPQKLYGDRHASQTNSKDQKTAKPNLAFSRLPPRHALCNRPDRPE